MITNTIVAFNSSGIHRSGGASPSFRFNCVYGNERYDYFGLTDPTGTDGNISADPLLADVEYGNTHVQPASPCVGAGSNGDMLGDLDIDGQPRIQPTGGIVTTIEGQRRGGSVVTARAGYGAVSTIDGFTITNGSAFRGGGLYLRYASRTIANNVVAGNSAIDRGGGLYLSSSSPTITGSTITGNTAYYHGGGLYLEDSSPTIVDSTIAGNTADREQRHHG